MDESKLTLLIQAEAQSAIVSLKNLNGEIKKTASGLKQVQTNVSGTKNNFNDFNSGALKSSKSINTLSSSFSKLGKMIVSVYAIKKLTQFLYESARQSINYTETLNLFTTALGNNAEKGVKFQNQMNEMFGTNKEELMRSQGLYTAIATSIGLASDQAYMLGENLTKLSLDLSSLYNKDIELVNQALKSGLVGQTKAVRQLGMDITEKTLNNELLAMGITDRTTAVMSQTEKVVLRYIVMLKQAGLAQGDFSKTIESPANQLRILKQQFVEITKWIGNIFYGSIAKVLPYIVAFSMTLKSIIQSFALFLGFKEQTFGGALFTDLGADELSDGLDDSTKSAKKLKNVLMSFDEINNISTPDGEDKNTGVGIDSRLLDAMSNYNNAMTEANMKAVKIRDTVLEWLGFTKQVNEATGEVTFKFTGINNLSFRNITESLNNLWNAIKEMTRINIDLLIEFYKSFVEPISKIVIEQTLPAFINLCASAINLFSSFYSVAKPFFHDFLEKILTPLSRVVLSVINEGLKNLSTIFVDLGNWVKDHPNVVPFLTGFFGALLIIKNLTTIGAILKTISSPLSIMLIAIGGVVLYYDDIKKFWDSLSGGERLAVGLGALASGIFLVALAVASLQSAWTLGIGAAAITAGIFAVSNAIDKIKKDADKQMNLIGPGAISAPGSSGSLKVGAMINGKYAEGGFPSTGQMFLARESGPELVGSIGNRTAVVNNDQIVSAVSQGVARAVSGVMGNGGNQQFQLYIGDTEITDLIVKSINGKTQQYGVSPLKG